MDFIEDKINHYQWLLAWIDNFIATTYATAYLSDDNMSEDEDGMVEPWNDAIGHMPKTSTESDVLAIQNTSVFGENLPDYNMSVDEDGLDEEDYDAVNHRSEISADNNVSGVGNAAGQDGYLSEDKMLIAGDTTREDDSESVVSSPSNMSIDNEVPTTEFPSAEPDYLSDYTMSTDEETSGEDNYDNDISTAESPSAEPSYQLDHKISTLNNRITSTTLPLETPGFVRFGPYSCYVLSLYLIICEQLSHLLVFNYEKEKGSSYRTWGMSIFFQPFWKFALTSLLYPKLLSWITAYYWYLRVYIENPFSISGYLIIERILAAFENFERRYISENPNILFDYMPMDEGVPGENLHSAAYGAMVLSPDSGRSAIDNESTYSENGSDYSMSGSGDITAENGGVLDPSNTSDRLADSEVSIVESTSLHNGCVSDDESFKDEHVPSKNSYAPEASRTVSDMPPEDEISPSSKSKGNLASADLDYESLFSDRENPDSEDTSRHRDSSSDSDSDLSMAGNIPKENDSHSTTVRTLHVSSVSALSELEDASSENRDYADDEMSVDGDGPGENVSYSTIDDVQDTSSYNEVSEMEIDFSESDNFPKDEMPVDGEVFREPERDTLNFSVNEAALTEETTKGQEPLVDFHKLIELPHDLFLYFLRFILVSPVPIANPWLVHDYRRGPSAECRKFMRPNILATCKDIHALGMGMLYGYNTFCFIHEHATLPDGNCGRCPDIGAFLCAPLKSVRPPWDNPGYIIRRHDLITKIILQDDDRDSDVLASKGFARLVSTDTASLNKYLSWQFCIVRIFEYNGLKLDTLTLNFDQGKLRIDQDLLEERRLRTLSNSTDVSTFLTEAEARERHRPGSWTLTHREGLNPAPEAKAAFSKLGLRVTKIIVRGTSWRTSEPQITFTGNIVNTLKHNKGLGYHELRSMIPNTTALRISRWLLGTNIHFHFVEFSGPFKERRINEDGSLILDDEWEGQKKQEKAYMLKPKFEPRTFFWTRATLKALASDN
jgi:hypothetical protein